MNLKSTRVFLGGLLAAMMLSALFAGSAVAAPQWKFNEKALEGEETIVGGAEKSGLTISGMTTTCANFLYEITIKNSGGVGSGKVTDLPLFNCTTDTKCTVQSITPSGFPWAANLKEFTGKNYIVIEGIHVSIVYGNPLCAFFETEVEVTGKAGGLIDNATESATFDESSFKATSTKLEAFGTEVKWKGFFPAEAFQWHRQEALTVS